MKTEELMPSSPGWPVALDEIAALGRVEKLFVAGAPLPPMEEAIAIVGTRRPTVAGLDAARLIATGLAEAGFTIVSGLALGIDTAAHRSALDAGGRTVAVLGCGIDVAYPGRNVRLKEQIAQDGTVVSEYPAGTQPQKGYFPARNRLIAGLATATVVIEGGLASGALITARLALDANRSVFAVPGSIRNPMAAGPNDLIKRSLATAVTGVQDILDELAPGTLWTEPVGALRNVPQLEDEELLLLSLLDDAPVGTEKLTAESGLSVGRAALGLSRLEVLGYLVKRGATFCITSAGCRVRSSLASDQTLTSVP
ncbi:MAG: DNA-processing protein DprA [Actinomycetota bacterium]